jgi:addiction module HigA family antidote
MSKIATTIKKVLLSLDESEELLRAAKSVPLAPADVTPGEILLEEFMKPLGLSGNALAKRMNVDPMRVNEIVRGKRVITAETALRLAAVFGTSARFWLGLQNDHDLALAAKGPSARSFPTTAMKSTKNVRAFAKSIKEASEGKAVEMTLDELEHRAKRRGKVQ